MEFFSPLTNTSGLPILIILIVGWGGRGQEYFCWWEHIYLIGKWIYLEHLEAKNIMGYFNTVLEALQG